LKKISLVLTLGVVLLASVLIINTLRFTSKQIRIDPIQPVGVDEDIAAQHLAQALRFQTISYQEPGQTKGEEFLALHKYLEQTFPKVHATLTKELVGNYSLLYTWKGSDENLKPILLMAHQDVVPVEPETLDNWEERPFEGRITGGYIWGRGAMDDKSTLLGLMESAEMLLGQGFQPLAQFLGDRGCFANRSASSNCSRGWPISSSVFIARFRLRIIEQGGFWLYVDFNKL
jgi:carboxypeptidase PM20D1